MPPSRRAPPNVNPLDLFLQLLAAFFADGSGGSQKAAKASFLVVALCVVLTGGWYLFQPQERKHEIALLVGNYSQQHKQIKVTEVLWDI